MGIKIRHADEDDLETWDRLVARSPQATPFHTVGAMNVLADHANATLHPLIGYKGQEPVGLFPLYELKKGPFDVVFSPPPSLKLPYQGPVQLNHEKLKQRKAETARQQFVEGCLTYVDETIGPKYTHVRTGSRYPDVRPFAWAGFEVTPRYTYVVDLTPGKEALLAEFSSDARRNVTGEYDVEYEVREHGKEAIAPIVAQLKERHEAQGEPYAVTPAFVEDLWEATPEGTVRPYVCTIEGEFAGGMIALESNDTRYRWQGGAKTDAAVPVNDLVDWQIMADGIDAGLARYDLVGASTQRLTGYKAKFAPNLEVHYEMERSSHVMQLAADVYSRVMKSSYTDAWLK